MMNITNLSSTNEISIFSLNLHFICQSKFSLDIEFHNKENTINNYQTQISSTTIQDQ